MDGRIKSYRKLLERERYSDINVRLTFIHLIHRVNYVEGSRRGRKIMPGQIVIGLNNFAKEIGISVKKLRLALQKLQQTGELDKQTTNEYTLITLLNWDKYQSEDVERANEGQTKGKQRATIEEYKNIRKKYISKDIYKEKILPIIDEYIEKGYRKEDLCEEANNCWRHYQEKGGIKIASTTYTNRLKNQIKRGKISKAPKERVYLNDEE